MLSFILKRVLATVPVMGVVALIVFLLLRLSPGDPAAVIAGDYATAEQIEKIRTALGLAAGPGWIFQQELAKLAKTVSGVELPAVPPTEPDPAERAEELREDLVSAFRHPGTEPE